MGAFNNNIQLIRGLTGLTQPLFARLIKSNESNVKTWETTEVGTKNFAVLQILAELSGVSVADLKNKILDKKDIAINVEMVEKFKAEVEAGVESENKMLSVVSEPPAEYLKSNNSSDYLAGRLAEKDATIEQIEKRIQEALSFAKKMEGHYEDVKAEKAELIKTLNKNQTLLDKAQDAILEVLKPIKEQSAEILANSKKAQEGLLSLKTEIVAEHGEMMETLDQIAGNEPGTTAAKAGTVELAHRVHKTNKGKKAGTGKHD